MRLIFHLPVCKSFSNHKSRVKNIYLIQVKYRFKSSKNLKLFLKNTISIRMHSLEKRRIQKTHQVICLLNQNNYSSDTVLIALHSLTKIEWIIEFNIFICSLFYTFLPDTVALRKFGQLLFEASDGKCPLHHSLTSSLVSQFWNYTIITRLQLKNKRAHMNIWTFYCSISP